MTWIAVYDTSDNSLYSMGTVVAGKSTLEPNGFKGIVARNEDGEAINPQEHPQDATYEWNPDTLRFRVVTSEEHRQREIARLKARLAELEG